jgi:hypothetical protein
LGLDEAKLLPEEKEQLLALARTLAQKVTAKVHEGTTLAQLRALVRQVLLHCVTVPGADALADTSTEALADALAAATWACADPSADPGVIAVVLRS